MLSIPQKRDYAMKKINNPCLTCADHPHHCRGFCRDKMKYMNETDEDIPVIRGHKQKKRRVFSNKYNKNGIRRS